jgi:hypothetical protein
LNACGVRDMTDEQNKLYFLIGEIKAGVQELKESHINTQTELKCLRNEMMSLQMRTNGIKPVLSGAGLGGLFGAAAAYITKYLM